MRLGVVSLSGKSIDNLRRKPNRKKIDQNPTRGDSRVRVLLGLQAKRVRHRLSSAFMTLLHATCPIQDLTFFIHLVGAALP